MIFLKRPGRNLGVGTSSRKTKSNGSYVPRVEFLEDRTAPAGAATHFGMTAPATVLGGPPFGLTVRALDAQNSVATGYLGTIHFGSSDPGASLPSDCTFTTVDAGVHSFFAYVRTAVPGVVTLTSPGPQSVRATDTVNAAVKGNVTVTVLVESDPPEVGGVTESSARIFARTAVPAAVAIEYSTAPSLAGSATTASASTGAAGNNTVILQLSGLQSATTYYYRVLANGVPQQIGPYPSFTTFPAPGSASSFSFAVIADTATTTEFPNQRAPAYASIAAEHPAFVIQPGDFDHRNPQSLPEFYDMDRQNRGPYDAAGKDWATYIAPNFPVDHIYDDHDYGTNNGDSISPTRLMAMQSYQLYYPTYNLVDPTLGMQHTFTYGQVQVFVLDMRAERDPDANPDGPAKSILGSAQEAWLKGALLASTAKWKVVVSSVALNQTSGSDGWSAFRDNWADVVNFIQQNNIQGVFAVSADLHSLGGIDDGTNSGIPELNAPYNNLTGGHPLDVVGRGWTQGVLTGKNQGGYALVQVLTNPDRVILYAKAQDGTVRFSYAIPLVGSPHFVVSRQASVTAGAPFSLTVTAVDSAGNVLTGYRGTVHFTSTDAQAGLPADYTFTAADGGIHTFSGVTLTLAGTATTLSVRDAGGLTGTIEQTVAPGAAAGFLFGPTVSAAAGSAFNVTVEAVDAFGNVASGYAGTIHFTSTDPGATLPADYTFTTGTKFGTFDQGVHTFTFTLRKAGKQKVTGTDLGNPAVVGTLSVNVSPLAAVSLTVTAPSSWVAGSPFTLTVTALDSFGNLASGYTGTVHFTGTDPRAVLPADYTFVPGDGGSHQFIGLSLFGAGAQTVTGTDSANGSLTGTAAVQVLPGAAASLMVSGPPAAVAAGSPFAITVTAFDAYGNVAIGYAGRVQFASSDGQATVPGVYNFQASDQGVHTFAGGVTLRTAGAQTVTATDPSLGPFGISVTVTPGPVSRLGLAVTSPVTAGVATGMTLSALDAFGNVVTGYTGTVHFTSSDSRASLPADYSFQPGDLGVHAFPAGLTLRTWGSQQLSATDLANGQVSGVATVVVVPRLIAVGADAGSTPRVRVFDAVTGSVVADFMAYDQNFRGGVRVAVGDFTGDGMPEVVTTPGPTGGPDVRIFNAATGALLQEYMAYALSFTGGVYVAAGDLNQDGKADVITGPDQTGGPDVRAFRNGTLVKEFMAYSVAFTGGVRLAVGDVNGDGVPDLVTAPGPGGGPDVRVWDGKTGGMSQEFFPYSVGFTGGVYVAAGDTNGDGKADIVTGPGAGGGPHLEVFSGQNHALLKSFFPYDVAYTGGVRLAAVDVNGDGRADVVVGPGLSSSGLQVQALDTSSLQRLDTFFAFDPGFNAGVFVGGA